MKFRHGFVSNSSSTSFICFTTKDILKNTFLECLSSEEIQEVIDRMEIDKTKIDYMKEKLTEWLLKFISNTIRFNGVELAKFNYLSSSDYCGGWPDLLEDDDIEKLVLEIRNSEILLDPESSRTVHVKYGMQEIFSIYRGLLKKVDSSKILWTEDEY